MSRCEFSSEANADLEQIHDFIAADSVAAARRIIINIRQVCKILADFPGLGIERPQLGDGFRSFPVRRTPYLIIYRPVTDGVEILHIHHGRRTLV